MASPDPPIGDPQAVASRPVLGRIRAQMPSLKPGEAKVAAVLLERPADVVYRSVTEVAEAAGVSTATVVRCAQVLEFRGFHDLKLALNRELGEVDRPRAQEGDGDNDRGSLLARVTALGAQTVSQAAVLIDPSAFERAAELLDEADHILVSGVGTSAPLAHDAGYRLSTIGLRSVAPADAHVQHVAAAALTERDVCLVISHTGSTRETLTVADAAVRAGASTIAVTSFLRSPLTEVATVALVAGTREVFFGLEAMASRLAHMAVLDALMVAVAGRSPERAEAALDRYTAAVSEHRL